MSSSVGKSGELTPEKSWLSGLLSCGLGELAAGEASCVRDCSLAAFRPLCFFSLVVFLPPLSFFSLLTFFPSLSFFTPPSSSWSRLPVVAVDPETEKPTSLQNQTITMIHKKAIRSFKVSSKHNLYCQGLPEKLLWKGRFWGQKDGGFGSCLSCTCAALLRCFRLFLALRFWNHI